MVERIQSPWTQTFGRRDLDEDPPRLDGLPFACPVAVAFFARGGSNRPRAIAEAARTIYYGFAAAVRTSFNAAVNPSSQTWTLQSQP